MAKVLGLSASARPWGNTDLLVHHALRGAEGEGAEVRFLRLGDLSIGPCCGCMGCVFKGQDCAQPDGLGELLAAWRWADAVALGSPTYVLGATAALKNLQDRMIGFGARRELAGRPGLALAAAGVPGWEPWALPQVALTFLFLGMPVVDQVMGYAQGPGEVLDDPAACRRATEGGAALARGETAYRGAEGACPVCHFDLVTTRADGSAFCPLCDLSGRWAPGRGRPVLEPAPGAESRWSATVMRHHFEDRILPSGPRFKARIKELKGRVEAFRRGAAP